MKTLVITDSKEIVQDISLCLRLRWPEVTVVSVIEGSKGVELVETELPDVVILDFDLLGGGSFDVVSEIRLFSDVPMVVLSATDNERDKVRALEMGADEYIVKPFSPVDFLARVNALLRRAGMPELRQGYQSPFVRGNLRVDFATREVFVSGRPVSLTPTEYSLLSCFVRNEARIVTHDTLLNKVWGPEYAGDRSLLKKYISRLRMKLCSADNTRMILPERGVGYKFVSRQIDPSR